jgi:hypothetical protein
MKWFMDLCLQPGGYWVAIVILGLVVCLTFVTSVACVQWRKLREAEQNAGLTQEMIQRGMSAGEIVQVLNASHSRTWRYETLESTTESTPGGPSQARLPQTADFKG